MKNSIFEQIFLTTLFTTRPKIYNRMKRSNVLFLTFTFLCSILATQAQEKVYPGADENSESRSQYFSWINNTNEGATEQQTLINLDFFKWLHDEYGMQLDIYAFDAGAIDGKLFYGKTSSPRFKNQFPHNFDPIYRKAKDIGTRLGVWGGPDGFGNTPEEAEARKAQMETLCRDYEFELFKFDAVCGRLRPEKEKDFIEMMQRCRSYSPDLILLNHRLGLSEGKAYATTFLWDGQETYIDVFTNNNVTAPHHRAGALERGLVPDFKRLAEDHGVCLSSCLDYWDDDLVLQAFSRSLILSPEIYGNPWLLPDHDFPKLARLYNLHKHYNPILIKAMHLPESYGPYGVSRGDAKTRILTLRNLTWKPKTYTIQAGQEIGLTKGRQVHVRIYHPYEKVMNNLKRGESFTVEVPPFRAMLLAVSSTSQYDEPAIEGAMFELVRNVKGKPIEIKVEGMPGTKATIKLAKGTKAHSARLDGVEQKALIQGKSITIDFGGDRLTESFHRHLATLQPTPVTDEAGPLYEATAFAADNNALEVRSLQHSGASTIPQVKAARKAFFQQKAFVHRGCWDKNLFDGDMETGFWPSVRYGINQRINGGCFRLDLGQIMHVDSIVMKVNDEFALQPLLLDEANLLTVSTDLRHWTSCRFLAQKTMHIKIDGPMRFAKLKTFPSCLNEIEVYNAGKRLDPSNFRVNNLFSDSHARSFTCKAMWKTNVKVSQIPTGSYLCVAVNGEHGVEGAYAALKIDGQLIGAPDRATSYPSNTWEYVNCRKAKNYTYYFPLDKKMENKKIEVYLMGYDKDHLNLKPEVWVTAYPVPYRTKTLILN